MHAWSLFAVETICESVNNIETIETTVFIAQFNCNTNCYYKRLQEHVM